MGQDHRQETRQFLDKLGLPDKDLNELPTSGDTFDDGAHYRIEVPTINTVECLRALLETAEELDTTINRIDMTYGIFRQTDDELEQYLALCKEHGAEALLGVGPRAYFDTGAQVLADTIWAHVPGYRLRGMEQIVRAVEDVHRAISFGCKGIIVYDEGLLMLLNEMKTDGLIPDDMELKASAVLGYCNPIGCKMLEQNGADSINPQRDLEMSMIAAIREGLEVPIDIHADNPPASGEFIRTYEAPEMVRVGSPIYIKTGNSRLPRHGYRRSGAEEGKEIARQVSLTSQFIEQYYPEAVQTEAGSKHLAIPE